MVSSLIKALVTGLSLWQSKESRKYKDKLIKLNKEYWREYNKERSDMAVLDNIEFELRLLSQAFYSEVGAKNFMDSSK